MLANGLNLDGHLTSVELSLCGNACWVSMDFLTAHMVVYSPVARMTTLNDGAISRT